MQTTLKSTVHHLSLSIKQKEKKKGAKQRRGRIPGYKQGPWAMLGYIYIYTYISLQQNNKN